MDPRSKTQMDTTTITTNEKPTIPNTTPSTTAKGTDTTRIGPGRHSLPPTLTDWPEWYQPPPKPATSAQLAAAWGTGVRTGGRVGYVPKPSVVSDPSREKYVPGMGGVAGVRVERPKGQLFSTWWGWSQS